MLIYSVATGLSCFLAWYEQKWEKAKLGRKDAAQSWMIYLFCGMPLLLVSMMRWGVGTDFYCTYLPEFRALQWLRNGGGETLRDTLFAEIAPRLSQWGLPDTPEGALEHFLGVLEKSELGYRALMELGVWMGGNFRVVIAVTSILITASVFYVIFTQSNCPVLAVYLYVATSNYFLSLNIIRQYVAIGIGLIAVRYIQEKRLLPFLACVAVAMLFHTTAILLLPCYFLCRIELKPRYALLLVALTLAVSGMLGTLGAWLMPRIGLGYYARYLDSSWAEDGFETMLFAINLCVMIFCGWYWQKAKQKSRFYVIWYNMTLLGTLALALSGVLPLMKRINYYYAAPQFLMLPEALNAEDNPKRRRVLTVLMVLAFAAETIVAVGIYNKNGPLPYQIFAE